MNVDEGFLALWIVRWIFMQNRKTYMLFSDPVN